MKTTAFIAFLIMSMACFAQQPVKPKADSPPVNKKGVRILTIPEGTYECRLAASGSKRDCKAIPVIVLVRSDGTCIALLPYNQVQVRTTGSEAVVSWKLFSPPGYAFDPSVGIDITSSDASKPIGDVWKAKNRDSPDVFSWKMKKGAPQRSFGHVPNVFDSGGNSCDFTDPVIANDAN